MDYILFIKQEGNWGNQSIIIPYKEFLSVRSDDYKILKENTTSIITENKTKIDGVILEEIIWNGPVGISKKTEINRIIDYIITYHRWADDFRTELNDKVWLDKSYENICEGTNHIDNFLRCRKLTKYNNKNINIVDSFLILPKHIR